MYQDEHEVVVKCEAKNCIFNEGEMCHAKEIDIVGQQACESDDTECSSFVNK